MASMQTEQCGGAGHSEEIVKRLSKKGLLIGIDRDEEALKAAKERLKNFDNVRYIHGNHDEIEELLQSIGIEKVDGILLDLGVSSYQLDERARGFSYIGNAKLDMRMDKTQELTAEEVVNEYSEEELTKIIFDYGEERFSRAIAKNICKQRQAKRIETTEELVEALATAVYDLGCRVGIKMNLKAQGVTQEVLDSTIDRMAELAYEDQCTTANPKEPLISELKQIILNVYEEK